MADLFDDREPIPGESRLGLITSSVLLGCGVVAVISAGIASLVVPGLGTTVTAAFILLVVGGAAFVINLKIRRHYLRDVRNGEVIVRRPWRGESLFPPG